MPQGPTFKHDCDACVSLGVHEDAEGKHDLYFCPDWRHKFHTVLARFGNEGHEYRSFSVDSNVKELFERRPDYVLAVTYRKALDLGLFK